ncbi:hypothetical protein [Luteimicrobium sp. DT211]|uniref:hypothetical protein n=1 Tax=Luteimicrobium sp. DT211 TaxID=3393412 RepID=UPI003CF9ED3F
MKLHRSLAVPLVTALAAGLSIPALATSAFAANGDSPTAGSAACTSGTESQSDYATEDVSPSFVSSGIKLDGSTAAGQAVDFYHAESGALSSVAGLGYTIATNDGGAQPSYVIEIDPQKGDLHYATLVWEPYQNGYALATATGRFSDLEAGKWWTSKIPSGPGSQAEPTSLATVESLFPDATLLSHGVHLGTGQTTVSVISDTTFNCLTTTFGLPSDDAAVALGSAAVGKPVAPDLTSWQPVSPSFAWSVDGHQVATTATYTPTAQDLGKPLTVSVSGAADGHVPATVTSKPVTIAKGTFASTEAPVLSGTPVVGQTLTVTTGSWSAPDTTVTYQWYRDATKIGTGARSYKLTADDSGRKVSVQITAHANGFNDATTTTTPSSVTVKAAAFGATTPTITGTTKVGATLTAHAGSWPNATRLTYQWKRNGSSISGATKTTYVLTSGDRGTKITLTVTGTLPGYTTVSRTSTATPTIGYGTFTRTTTPSITGTVRVGNTVKASVGTWSSAASFTYQWKQNGHTITGATRSTYTPSASYRGHKLTVTITAKRTGYTTAVRTSPAKTIGYGYLSAPTPRITGTHQTRHTLKASAGTWKPSAHLTYRWKRNGVSIKGATHASYKTTTADRGKHLTVTITGKRTGYSTRSRTSASAYITAPFTHTHAPTITGTTRVYSRLTAHVTAWSPKASISYRWKRDGKAISGATHSTYKLAAADYHHHITVTITGKRGTYTTTTRTSTRTPVIYGPKGVTTPKITAQPQPVLVNAGTTTSFSVKATGGMLHYQWQYSDTNGASWKSLSGKTSAKLTVVAHSVVDLRRFRVVVKNVVGSRTSAAAIIFINSSRSQPFIANQVFQLDSYLAVVGKSSWAPSPYGGNYLAAPAQICAFSDGQAIAPWTDLHVAYIGGNGHVYADEASDQADDVYNTMSLDKDGCATFTLYAPVPSSAVSGGTWRITDSTYSTYNQYVRWY